VTTPGGDSRVYFRSNFRPWLDLIADDGNELMVEMALMVGFDN